MAIQIRLAGMVALALAAPVFLMRCGGGESTEESRIVNRRSDEVAESSEHKQTNRLIHETSPYLLQHAHNPVDWYPWGDEAFEKAKRENKPILLSIGYSACHWCHVMEKESFENEEIAAMMNEHYVCIKVDREERPDVDNIYMTAVQLMTRQGGWPLTVFMTPDGKPFFGGTYFPPRDAMGRPGFPSVLLQLSRFYRENSANPETLGKIEELVEQIRKVSAGPAGEGDAIDRIDMSLAVDRLRRSFDQTWGGFGGAPKFPSCSSLDLLLRYHFRTGDETALSMVTRTLDKMMRGGMYDQLGGGFHRYSVDERWLIPHFEKMLYDNGLLAPVYLDAWVVTGNDEYRRVAEEILDYIDREMTAPGGSFYSSEDADSEGEEGKYYVWTREEIIALLGPSEGAFTADYFGVTETGNFEHGTSALHLPASLEEAAKGHSIAVDEGRRILARAREKMLDKRSTRVRPGMDDKTLTEWNGMAVSAFARAGRLLGEDRYTAIAEKAAIFLLEQMTDGKILLHTWKDGTAKQSGFLSDYAYFTQALIDLYEATWNTRYLKEAIFWNGRMIDLFSDDENGGYFFTGDDNEELLAKSKDLFDGSVPSGNSVAARNLSRLARLTGDGKLREEAESVFRCFSSALASQPTAATTMLSALDFHYGNAREIVVVGKAGDPATGRFLEKVAAHYAPDAVVAYLDPGNGDETVSLVPLLKGKEGVGEPTLFVCRNYVCDAPVTDENALEEAIAASLQSR